MQGTIYNKPTFILKKKNVYILTSILSFLGLLRHNSTICCLNKFQINHVIQIQLNIREVT